MFYGSSVAVVIAVLRAYVKNKNKNKIRAYFAFGLMIILLFNDIQIKYL